MYSRWGWGNKQKYTHFEKFPPPSVVSLFLIQSFSLSPQHTHTRTHTHTHTHTHTLVLLQSLSPNEQIIKTSLVWLWGLNWSSSSWYRNWKVIVDTKKYFNLFQWNPEWPRNYLQTFVFKKIKFQQNMILKILLPRLKM